MRGSGSLVAAGLIAPGIPGPERPKRRNGKYSYSHSWTWMNACARNIDLHEFFGPRSTDRRHQNSCCVTNVSRLCLWLIYSPVLLSAQESNLQSGLADTD